MKETQKEFLTEVLLPTLLGMATGLLIHYFIL